MALRFPIRWCCSYHKDKNDNPQTVNAPQLSDSIGHKRESDINFRASDFSNALILIEHVFVAKHTRLLNEMFVSISLYLLHGHRHNLRGRKGKIPHCKYFFYLRFFGGGGLLSWKGAKEIVVRVEKRMYVSEGLVQTSIPSLYSFVKSNLRPCVQSRNAKGWAEWEPLHEERLSGMRAFTLGKFEQNGSLYVRKPWAEWEPLHDERATFIEGGFWHSCMNLVIWWRIS